jgi:hypothetical protein
MQQRAAGEDRRETAVGFKGGLNVIEEKAVGRRDGAGHKVLQASTSEFQKP